MLSVSEKCKEASVPGAGEVREAAGARLKRLSLAFLLSMLEAIGGL